jgi:hypothetical protein
MSKTRPLLSKQRMSFLCISVDLTNNLKLCCSLELQSSHMRFALSWFQIPIPAPRPWLNLKSIFVLLECYVVEPIYHLNRGGRPNHESIREFKKYGYSTSYVKLHVRLWIAPGNGYMQIVRVVLSREASEACRISIKW